MNRSKVLALSICLIIYGCANNSNTYMQQKTQAQYELERLNEVLATSKLKYDECRKNNNQIDSIRTVDGLILEDQNDKRKLEFLTSKTLLTKEYKLAIKEAFPLSNKCRGIALEGISKAHADLAEVQANGYASFDYIMVDVINDKIKTVSDLNRRYLEALSEYNARWSEAQKRIYSNLEQQHTAELQGRRVDLYQRQVVANMAIQNWMNAQQQFNTSLARQNYINRTSKPTYTNCNVIGNTVNCSSY